MLALPKEAAAYKAVVPEASSIWFTFAPWSSRRAAMPFHPFRAAFSNCGPFGSLPLLSFASNNKTAQSSWPLRRALSKAV